MLLHGLTATRRYVVMGSRSLERSGHRVLAYDARGHGASDPAADGDYGYARLAADLGAVLDAAGFERAVLAGASMGAHTAVRFALEEPARVAALALITPSFDPAEPRSEAELARWDALARGLREGGVDGFVAAYDLAGVAEPMRATVETVLRQRLAAHGTPPPSPTRLKRCRARRRSRTWASSRASRCRRSWSPAATSPTRATRSRSASATPRGSPARDSCEEEPARSPIAWQGGQLSKLIAATAADVRT